MLDRLGLSPLQTTASADVLGRHVEDNGVQTEAPEAPLAQGDGEAEYRAGELFVGGYPRNQVPVDTYVSALRALSYNFV